MLFAVFGFLTPTLGESGVTNLRYLLISVLGFGDPIDEFFDISTWLGAIGGAALLLVLYRALFGARRTTRTI